MKRFVEIATELGPLYHQRAMTAFTVKLLLGDIESRKVELIPDGGWPGSNDAQRKAAAESAYRADGLLYKLRDDLAQQEFIVADVTAEIERLEAERRALEYRVKGALARAFGADPAEDIDVFSKVATPDPAETEMEWE